MGKWMIFFVLLSNWGYAQQGSGSIKDLKFLPENLKQFNKIEVLGESKRLQNVVHKMGTCYPLELTVEGNKKLYRPSRSPHKIIKYVELVWLNNTDKYIEMTINKNHIKGSSLAFRLIDNCTKLIPISFTAVNDQNYLGVKLKTGNVISPFVNNMEHLIWGEIVEDGYLKGRWTSSRPSDDELLNNFKDFKYANNVYYSAPGCLKVNTFSASDDGFYIFKGKAINFNVSRPNFWHANSKYIGHRLCSDQPEAVVDCEGTTIGSDSIESEIFGITDPDYTFAVTNKEKETVKLEYQKDLARAKELGKRCDEAIAKYEKETGKKVKISPFYPKQLLGKDKANK